MDGYLKFKSPYKNNIVSTKSSLLLNLYKNVLFFIPSFANRQIPQF